jgi:hypothetical protein
MLRVELSHHHPCEAAGGVPVMGDDRRNAARALASVASGAGTPLEKDSSSQPSKSIDIRQTICGG